MPACADNPERCLKGQHSHAHPLALHPRSLPQALSSQCPAIALRASDQSRLADHSSFATRRICTLFTGGARQSRTWRALPTVVSHAAEDASGDASEAMVRSPIPAMVAQNSQGDDHVSPTYQGCRRRGTGHHARKRCASHRGAPVVGVEVLSPS